MLIAPIFAAKLIRKYHYSKLVWSILTFDGILAVIIAVLSINGIFPNIMINYISMIIVINILMITVIWVNLGIHTAMQLLVPGEMMGRVSSVIGTFAMIAMPLVVALMGYLLEIAKKLLCNGGLFRIADCCRFFVQAGFCFPCKKGQDGYDIRT